MKTNKKVILVVVFMLGTLFNYAANNEGDFNKVVNANKVRVAFNNVKKGQLLTVKDNKGLELHSEIVSGSGLLTKVFDLSSLQDGTYTIELNKDFQIIVQTLEVKNNKVIFNKDSKKTIFKPVIRNEDNILLISKSTLDKEAVKVALFFENEMIFSETVNSDADLKRVYKLDDKKEGSYNAVIYKNNRSYTHNFKI
jgi:hypothetical protein